MGAAEGRGKLVERGRGADRRDRRAVERLLAGTSEQGWLIFGHDAVVLNPELQHDYTLVPKLRRFRHHGVPVAFDASQHPREIVAEVHPLGWRKQFDVSPKVTLPTSAQAATAARTRRRRCRAAKLRAGASPVLESLVERFLQSLPRREAREDQTARLLRRRLYRLEDTVLGRLLCPGRRRRRGGLRQPGLFRRGLKRIPHHSFGLRQARQGLWLARRRESLQDAWINPDARARGLRRRLDLRHVTHIRGQVQHV